MGEHKKEEFRRDTDGGVYDILDPVVMESGGRLGKGHVCYQQACRRKDCAKIAAESDGVEKHVP